MARSGLTRYGDTLIATLAAFNQEPRFSHRLGAAMLLYVAVGSIARGKRVMWKGREYVAG